jgi:hypothetical protein
MQSLTGSGIKLHMMKLLFNLDFTDEKKKIMADFHIVIIEWYGNVQSVNIGLFRGMFISKTDCFITKDNRV